MSEDLFVDLMDQWLAADPTLRKTHQDKVAKPDRLFHYEGGFRMSEKNVLRRTKATEKPREVSRGAHP